MTQPKQLDKQDTLILSKTDAGLTVETLDGQSSDLLEMAISNGSLSGAETDYILDEDEMDVVSNWGRKYFAQYQHK